MPANQTKAAKKGRTHGFPCEAWVVGKLWLLNQIRESGGSFIEFGMGDDAIQNRWRYPDQSGDRCCYPPHLSHFGYSPVDGGSAGRLGRGVVTAFYLRISSFAPSMQTSRELGRVNSNVHSLTLVATGPLAHVATGPLAPSRSYERERVEFLSVAHLRLTDQTTSTQRALP